MDEPGLVIEPFVWRRMSFEKTLQVQEGRVVGIAWVQTNLKVLQKFTLAVCQNPAPMQWVFEILDL